MVRKGQTRLMQGTRLMVGGDTQVKECGADANIPTKTGMTAVMYAAKYGHTETALALVRVMYVWACVREQLDDGGYV